MNIQRTMSHTFAGIRAPVVRAPPRHVCRVGGIATEKTTTMPSNQDIRVVDGNATSAPSASSTREMAERRLARRNEQFTYQATAIAATLGIGAVAVAATWYRFYHHMDDGSDFPVAEFLATLTLIAGGTVGMEMYARWAHKALWHDNAWGWSLHKSHHKARVGPFEDNDIFAIMNAVPALALIIYGFFTPNVMGGMAYGAGLGITLFGISYMFIHDGLVHRRFPVGPIGELPYLRRVAVAHQLHHSAKYKGVPWGLFLGPQELEAAGGKEELDRLVEELGKERKEVVGEGQWKK